MNAKMVSNRFRDQRNTPMETAIYWVEYVVRHKGAPHLRVGAVDLDFAVKYSLDVIGFIVFSCILTAYVVLKIVKIVLSRTNRYENFKRKIN